MKKLLIWSWMAFILCGLLIQLPAYAATTPPTGNYLADCQGGRMAGSTQDSVMEQCRANYETYWRGHGYPTCSVVISNVSRVYPMNFTVGWCGNNFQNLTVGLNGPASCPPEFTGGIVNGMCTGGPDPVVCTAGKSSEYTFAQGASLGPGKSSAPYIPSNVGGCVVTPTEVVRCYSTADATGGGRTAYCTYKVTETGVHGPAGVPAPSSVPATGAKSENAPASSPPPGQTCVSGTVVMGTDSAGTPICGGSGTAPTVSSPPPTTVKPPVSVANPDGSTTVTKVTERLNTDGSKTTVTETTVTASDGTATTTKDTVTGKAGDGVSTGKADATEEENKDDFCKKHPELNVCRNSSVSGTCAAVACTGDAIQCAIYRQQQKEYCENTAANPISTLGSQVLNGTDPFADPFANPTSVGVGSFSFSDLLGGRSCPANSVIPLPGGGTFSIVFTPICDFAAIMRPILIAAASFGALWLVVGGI